MKLPSIFCVAAPEEGAVAVFTARLSRPNVYIISPYRIFHSGAVETPKALYKDSQSSPLSEESITFIECDEVGQTSYAEIHWQYTGKTIYSMCCGVAIPQLQFVLQQTLEGRGHFTDFIGVTAHEEHHLQITAGTSYQLKIWARRWNPEYWRRDHGSGVALQTLSIVASQAVQAV